MKPEFGRVFQLMILAAAALYNDPAFSIWGGQEYIAVPNVSRATSTKVLITRSYVVNNGKSVSDDYGNIYQFGAYIVKDQYYLNAKQKLIYLNRTSSVSITMSGTFTGNVSISEQQYYQQPVGGVLRQVRTAQTITENLYQGNATGQATQTLNFKFNTSSVPPSIATLFVLPVGKSFRFPDDSDKLTSLNLVGSLCLSSQPNSPCPALSTQVTTFQSKLGWEVQGQLDSMTVKGITYPNVTVVGQFEPLIPLDYSTTCPSGISPCVVSPTAGTTVRATSWVANGVGTIKYQGPFYVPGRILTYQLKKKPTVKPPSAQ